VSADGWSSSAVAVNKAKQDGLTLECALSGFSGSKAVTDKVLIRVIGKDADSSWSTTPSATIDDLGCFPLVLGTSGWNADGNHRVFHTVYTNKKYLKLYYDITNASGSAAWTVTAGVVSGKQRDA
jgi:hypothetical protein